MKSNFTEFVNISRMNAKFTYTVLEEITLSNTSLFSFTGMAQCEFKRKCMFKKHEGDNVGRDDVVKPANKLICQNSTFLIRSLQIVTMIFTRPST